ncbi:MAG: translation initiation factor IF-2 [Candidatus Portnoybacteria bacterium]|nr:translation initiation factor IF-2 [Candidatus Portnoybacteria bacterium]
MAKKILKQSDNKLPARPPIVVILGHVDHGKTSLLDYIRKTKVAEKESGGITQHIGAYQVEHNGKSITFIDTPGHEAFSAMRSRGAKVADIAILVIAGEEGIKPQTKEAISHIKKAGLATIVAITKIDKPTAQPEKVKADLSNEGLIVESRDGDIPSVNVSSKTGRGIDELLEVILLVAEMSNLATDSSKPASGVVIESYRDPLRGPTATLLIQEGTLKPKDIVLTESTCGAIKRMENWQGKTLETATASQPISVLGLEETPLVGEKWQVAANIDLAREKSKKKGLHEQKKRARAEVIEANPGKKILNIILKADFLGSLEALQESLKSIKSEEVVLRILETEVGDISESDIKLAESARAKIIGFRVKLPNIYKQLAEQKNVDASLFQVIYELIQKVREQMAELLAPEIVRTDLAKLKVIALFKKDKSGQVIGAKVLSGKVENGLWIDVIRGEENIGRGKIIHLQYEKSDADTVGVGKNAGILFRGDIEIKIDDILMAYREEKKRRNL